MTTYFQEPCHAKTCLKVLFVVIIKRMIDETLLTHPSLGITVSTCIHGISLYKCLFMHLHLIVLLVMLKVIIMIM